MQQQEEESEVDWEESDNELPSVTKEAAPKSILKKKVQLEEADAPAPAHVSRAIQDRLDEDEREIRALEKKLGKRKKSAGGVDDDGLDDLFGCFMCYKLYFNQQEKQPKATTKQNF